MERTVVVKRLGLPPAKVKVRIWNDTVSNLTLMALGSSAPEILLSIIEVVGKGFEAGDLGPNTIVGSAAFNLFMIIAICVSAVPPKEVRRQKHLDVFFVTATWSIFAYVWLWAILAYFSPGVIEIWEGLVTFAFFPITKKFVPHRYRRGSHGMIATEGEELKMLETTNGTSALTNASAIESLVQATRRLVGGGDIVRKRLAREHDKALDIVIEAQERQARHNTCRIFFDPAHYTVLENVGTFDVVVGRDGGPEGLTVMVDYYTEDGTANAGSDYKPAKGTLTFYPEDRHCKIPIEIVDDDVFEEDEHFYLHLTNLRVRTRDGLILDPTRTYDGSATTGKHYEAKESGEILFEDNQTEAFIDIGIVDTEQYERSDFFYLELSPPVWTKKMSDMKKVQERFHRRMERKRASSADQQRRSSSAALNEQQRLNKSFDNRRQSTTSTLGEDENLMNLTPDQLEIAELGKPRLGEFRKCQITIKESKEFQVKN
uniref:Calx-beta domain-containing protein n=1 Tax=Meloidogyne javanica TaxID=6303 RepID=A0A915M9N9_MELJA